jgi:hypothetical protein
MMAIVLPMLLVLTIAGFQMIADQGDRLLREHAHPSFVQWGDGDVWVLSDMVKNAKVTIYKKENVDE